MPLVKLFSQVDVYDGWPCAATLRYAQTLIQQQPGASLQVLEYALRQAQGNWLEYPYVWWVLIGRKRVMPLFKDANQHSFIELNQQRHLVHSLRDTQGLVGARTLDSTSTPKVPRVGYFICWENEDKIMNLLGKDLVIKCWSDA